MSILVDPRAGKTNRMSSSEHLDKLVKLLQARVTTKVKVARPPLSAGDFCFLGNGPTGDVAVGVELKEVRDFLGSMRTDRLAGDQIRSMSQIYDFSYVLIYGLWKPAANDDMLTIQGSKWVSLSLAAKGQMNHFKYGELFRHVLSLEILKNVMVLRAGSVEEAMAQIGHLYAWWQRDWDAHRSTDPVKLQTEVVFARISLLRKMAAELPGIGWTRSKAVESAFMSVHAMVNAPVEAWESIEGIGPTIARRVWKALRDRV